MYQLRGLVFVCVAATIVLGLTLWTFPEISAPAPPSRTPVKQRACIFTYERGDVIGSFVVKIAAAMRAQGVEALAWPNYLKPDYFWHSAYRPNAFHPEIARNQSVFYNVENTRADAKGGETILQTRYPEPDQVGNAHLVYAPWAWVAFEERHHIPGPESLLRSRSNFDARTAATKKTRFCSFMASFCNYDSVYMQIYGSRWNGVKQERTKFFELLNATYKPVDALGRCHHNTEQPPPPPQARDKPWAWSRHDQSIWMMRPYKFAMCMENMATPGYFTEKLFNAYLAEAIPVYWGDPYIEELVNPDAFIWCRPSESWERCVARVKEVDQDEDRYLRMLATPILKANMIPDWMNYTVLALRLARLWHLTR
jgi:hypothetical protein